MRCYLPVMRCMTLFPVCNSMVKSISDVSLPYQMFLYHIRYIYHISQLGENGQQFKLGNLQLLIVDEISMVDHKLLTCIYGTY